MVNVLLFAKHWCYPEKCFQGNSLKCSKSNLVFSAVLNGKNGPNLQKVEMARWVEHSWINEWCDHRKTQSYSNK